MATKPREYKMLEAVRRWRREVYEERSHQTPTQRAEGERKLIESLGLSHLVKKPGKPAHSVPPQRRAG